jgi:toxin FitB
VYLLDTNVVSELRKVRAGRAEARVAAWAESVDAADLHLSVVSLQELEIGVLLKERSDPAQDAVPRRWLDDRVIPTFAARTLPVDVPVALRSAALHVPDPRPVRDGLIAGTALVHGLCVVTRNVADFEPMGVDALDPWWSS